jgi:hypothetical protein
MVRNLYLSDQQSQLARSPENKHFISTNRASFVDQPIIERSGLESLLFRGWHQLI